MIKEEWKFMWKICVLSCVVIVLFSSLCSFAQKEEKKGAITLSGAWAIYPTAVGWAEAFMKANPKVKIDVSAGGAGKGAADAIAGLVDIGMVSREPDPAEIGKGILPIYVLHDAVYPIISSKNPFAKEIVNVGLKKQTWMDMYISGTMTNWGFVSPKGLKKSVHLYTRSDSCGAAASWAGYLGKKQEDLRGIGIYGDPGILDAVKRDPIGIGYSNFSYVFTREGTLLQGIQLVPIDSNENGVADPDEIFTDRVNAIKAIESDRYPSTRKNYFFTKGKPKGLVKEFILFALSDAGQQIVDQIGTSLPLKKEDRDRVIESVK